MKLSKLILIATTFLSVTYFGYAQESKSLSSDEDFYMFPIKPGVRNSLSGTMGELRSNHFHSGIDVRTDGRIGLPVHAAAEGYVSRIAVSTSGYGNAVYLLHPNGETTVYAHLDRFTGDLAEYIRKEQYRRKTFKLNLYFRANQFKVQKGDTIAYSGNSGSSGGPHLHFDIRDKNQKPLNPLTYNFEEILDHTPPIVRNLAIKSLESDARVNGHFGRFEFTPRRIGNDYVVDRPIEAKGLVGVELYAYDKLDNSRFRCGISNIVMTVDSKEVFRQTINTFSFAEQRNILAHMNFQELYNSGRRYHKMYVDDGNFLNFYKTGDKKGKLSINEGDTKSVKIAMTDTYGNTSYFSFKIKYGEQVKVIPNEKAIATPKVSLTDNTLIIKASGSKNATIELANTDKFSLSPSYNENNTNQVYLWNMKQGIPEKISVDEEPIELSYKNVVPPNISYKFYNEWVDINFPKRSLFDTLYMTSLHGYDSVKSREIFEIGNPRSPLRKNIAVTLKPQNGVKNMNKTHVYFLNGSNRLSYSGGKWESGKISFSTRRFGKFTLASDTIPPKITLVRADKETLKFKISDGLSGIRKFTCTINGKWVLMNYDHKRNLIWSEKLNKDTPFKGEVRLLLTDNANNKTEYTKLIN